MFSTLETRSRYLHLVAVQAMDLRLLLNFADVKAPCGSTYGRKGQPNWASQRGAVEGVSRLSAEAFVALADHHKLTAEQRSVAHSIWHEECVDTGHNDPTACILAVLGGGFDV